MCTPTSGPQPAQSPQPGNGLVNAINGIPILGAVAEAIEHLFGYNPQATPAQQAAATQPTPPRIATPAPSRAPGGASKGVSRAAPGNALSGHPGPVDPSIVARSSPGFGAAPAAPAAYASPAADVYNSGLPFMRTPSQGLAGGLPPSAYAPTAPAQPSFNAPAGNYPSLGIVPSAAPGTPAGAALGGDAAFYAGLPKVTAQSTGLGNVFGSGIMPGSP